MKMKYLPLYIILFLISFLSSCQNKSKDSNELMVFDLETGIGNPESFVLSDLISTISYIPLETCQESLMGSVHTIAIAEDEFLLTARNKGIKVFSNEGVYSHDIGGAVLLRTY